MIAWIFLINFFLTNSLYHCIFFKKEHVPEFLKIVPIEPALGALNDLYSKYKYMEQSFEKSKAVYKSKIPEISQSLELLEMMVEKRDKEEEMITNYSLCDTIFAKAKVGWILCSWTGYIIY